MTMMAARTSRSVGVRSSHTRTRRTASRWALWESGIRSWSFRPRRFGGRRFTAAPVRDGRLGPRLLIPLVRRGRRVPVSGGSVDAWPDAGRVDGRSEGEPEHGSTPRPGPDRRTGAGMRPSGTGAGGSGPGRPGPRACPRWGTSGGRLYDSGAWSGSGPACIGRAFWRTPVRLLGPDRRSPSGFAAGFAFGVALCFAGVAGA